MFIFDFNGTEPRESAGERSDVKRRIHVNGLRRLMTNKKVGFGFSEHYEFAACLLVNLRVELLNNPSLASDKNWWSTKWCTLVNYLRTAFEKQV